MSIADEKIRAITVLRFPGSLRQLETFLGLTGWLRSSIPRYAQRAQPLQDRKTRLTQDILVTSPASPASFAGTASPDGPSAPPKPAAKQLSGPARKRLSSRLYYKPILEELEAFRNL